MNKFSDGFSDNSYEDLLNEYAGEKISSKPINPPVPRKAPMPDDRTRMQRKSPSSETAFNIDAPEKKKPSDFSLDLNAIKAYNSPAPARRPAPKPAAPAKVAPSSTMQFTRSDFSDRRNRLSPESSVQSSAPRRAAKAPEKAEPAPKKLNIRKRSAEPSSSDAFAAENTKGKNNIGNNIMLALKHNAKAFIIFLGCFVVAGIISAVAISCINDVFAINRDDATVVEVVLPNDADTAAAVKTLKKAGLIKNEWFCKIFIKAMGYSDENYLPGVYYLTESMGVEKMITRFKTSTVRGNLISIAIPEGYTIDQIFEKLEKNDICSASSLYKTIDSIDFSKEYSFIQEIDNKDKRYHVLEGYFFPATYEFEQGADPATVIRKFLDTFQSRWTEDYAKRAAELSMSVDDIIRLASIIEKEGNSNDQFKVISSVLHNRLNLPGIYPLLECNSTRDYVTNTIAKRESSTTKINSYIASYNTYDCEGLPVGAICNPGASAIEAALNPEITKYKFFRHDKNGKIYLAETYEQHEYNGTLVDAVNKKKN